MTKTEFYADLNRDFQALMAGETSFLAVISNTSALLYERLSDVNWAGFYLLEGETLVLGPFQGKIACVRIPVGRGVCVGAVLGNFCRAFLALDQFAGLPFSARRIGVDALACGVGAAMHLGLGCRDHDSANGDSHQSACSHGFLLYREQRLSHRVR